MDMINDAKGFFDCAPGRVFVGAGPCGAESPEQLEQSAAALAATGQVRLMRAGIWKPRTRPGSFEGLGIPALGWLVEAGKRHGLATATEVATAEHAEAALKAGVDVLWLGARTTVNPFYVQEIAEALRGVKVPVMVKNPVHPELPLWLGAIERLHSVGLEDLAAVHRGFYSASAGVLRNEPKWELAVALREKMPEIPLLCDPSHIAGDRRWVTEIAQTALDLRYDGLLVEVHPRPESALSDGGQQWPLADFGRWLEALQVRSDERVLAELPADLLEVRTAIDAIDRGLVALIAQRFALLEPIAQVKKREGLALFQLDRWMEIVRTRKEWGEASGALPEALLQELFEVIHKHGLLEQVNAWRSLPPESLNRCAEGGC
ncbi:3-deoxy-7-phosphoheptulonate synthase [bacterium]|nr:3-deoxy-7-phosphoheptulonate synthase [bacterium]